MGNTYLLINTICMISLFILAVLLLYFFNKEKKNRKKILREHEKLHVSEEQYRIASAG